MALRFFLFPVSFRERIPCLPLPNFWFLSDATVCADSVHENTVNPGLTVLEVTL